MKVDSATARHQERQTHPQGNPNDYLQQHTAKTPNVNGPWVAIVVHHFLVEILLVLALVLVDDIVEDLRRHVFGGSHRELGYIPELER